MINILEKIKEYVKIIEIDDIGFCSAEPFFEMKKILERRKKDNNYTEFENSSIDDRVYPERVLKSAKSIIVIIEKYSNRKTNFKDNKMRGNISLIARGEDYHRILKRKSELMCRYLQKEFNSQCIYQVDTGPIVERAAAVRANLGWIGKNNCFYSYKYGSFVFIGCIITDLELPTSDNLGFNTLCGSCNKCIENCPTNALSESGISLKKCIAYNSVTKDNFNFDVLDKFNNSLYGCDVCQLVCPQNNLQESGKVCADAQSEDYNPTIENIINMTNAEYREKYGHTAVFWRGKKILKRNALISVINMKDDEFKKKIFDKIILDGSNEYLKEFLLKALQKNNPQMYDHYLKRL